MVLIVLPRILLAVTVYFSFVCHCIYKFIYLFHLKFIIGTTFFGNAAPFFYLGEILIGDIVYSENR
jgi:hypothetical protein